MDPAQFARLKDAAPVFLQFMKNAQRCRQFFVRCRQWSSCARFQVFADAPLQVYYDVRIQVHYAVWLQVHSAVQPRLFCARLGAHQLIFFSILSPVQPSVEFRFPSADSVRRDESRDCERPSVDQPTLSAESLCPLRADHLTLCPRGSVGSSQIYQQIVVEPLNSLDTVERIRIFQTGSEISDRGAECLSLIWIYFRSSGGSGPTGGPLIRKRNPRGCTAKGKRGGEYRPLREMACCSLGTVG